MKRIIVLLIIVLFLTGCSSIPCRSLLYDDYVKIDVTYYDEIENENVKFAKEFVNSILEKNIPDEHLTGSIYFGFHKKIKISSSQLNSECYGLTININENVFETIIEDFKNHIRTNKLLYGLDVNLFSDVVFDLYDLKKAVYRSTYVHELVHAYLHTKEVSNLPAHEYLAYAIGFMSLPDKYRDKINEFLKKKFKIIKFDYTHSSFINEFMYKTNPNKFEILSYNHFINHPEMLKKIIDLEFIGMPIFRRF